MPSMPTDAPPRPQIVFSGGGEWCLRPRGLTTAARGDRPADPACAAAAIPPILDPPLRRGRLAPDAGTAGHATEPDRGVLPASATRTRCDRPEDGRTPADPSEAAPAVGIRETWERGEADGRRFPARPDPERPERPGPHDMTTKGGET